MAGGPLLTRSVVAGAMHAPGDLVVAPTSIDRADAMKSNVLLLCVDDMNDWAGCLGGYPESAWSFDHDSYTWRPA